MIIDPPTPFHPLEDWTRFRKDMEAALKTDPDNADLLEHLDLAKQTEKRLKDQ